jgi:NAD(P)-dependent dehydrogenase (short-subunit alcohol dehydrogenase family)
MKPEQWTEVINTNLGSLFNMCRNVVEGMRERKFGRCLSLLFAPSFPVTGKPFPVNFHREFC